MPRGTIYVSLALHAGLLGFLDWHSQSETKGAGVGDPDVGVSFSVREAENVLLTAATPLPQPPTPQPALPEPDLDLPVSTIAPPAPDTPNPPTAGLPAFTVLIPAEIPHRDRPVPSARPHRLARSKAAASGEKSGGVPGNPTTTAGTVLPQQAAEADRDTFRRNSCCATNRPTRMKRLRAGSKAPFCSSSPWTPEAASPTPAFGRVQAMEFSIAQPSMPCSRGVLIRRKETASASRAEPKSRSDSISRRTEHFPRRAFPAIRCQGGGRPALMRDAISRASLLHIVGCSKARTIFRPRRLRK